MPPQPAGPDRPVLDVDVAIVGYGPVGALLALLLGRAGARCAVVDRREEVHALPRAVAADDEVLRILCAAGLADAVAAMVPVPGVTFLGRHGRAVLEADLDGGSSGHPGLALFRQPDLERALRGRVAETPAARPLLGRGVVGLTQDAAGVTLALDDGARLRASYVVGCDGARSTVRDLLGVPTRGPRTAQRWLVVDLRSDDPTPTPRRVTYLCAPGRSTVQMPTPGGRRLEFLLPPGGAEPDVVALLARHVDPAAVEVERAAQYEYRSRQARRWRVGRALLAGDAAHTMPPFVGQGLAAGLRDAVDLAWRLPLVLAGTAPETLLDAYERERRPHVSRMTALSRVAGAVLTTRSPGAAALRDAVLTTAGRAPALGAWLRRGGPRPTQALRPTRAERPAGDLLTAGARARDALRPLGLLPDARLAPRAGGPGAGGLGAGGLGAGGLGAGGLGAGGLGAGGLGGAGLPDRLDRLVASRFALLGLGVDPVRDLAGEHRELWDRLGALVATVVAPGEQSAAPGLVVDDVDRALLAYGRGRVAVLRPDRQVVALVEPRRLAEVSRRLARALPGAGSGGSGLTTRG